MDTIVRMAVHEDFHEILLLYAQLDRHHAELMPGVFRPFNGVARPEDFLKNLMDSEDTALFVAEAESRIVGFISLRKTSSPDYPMFRPREIAFIEDLVVEDDHRGHGIGRRLLKAARTWATEHKIAAIQAGMWSADARTREFYEQAGFRTVYEKMEETTPSPSGRG